MWSLWNLGIQDKLFNLIYLLNEKCNIIVKTPHGTTSSSSCPKIVKQGTVLSGNLCTSSTGELNDNLNGTGATIGNVNIKASLFVDDTWTPNTNVLDSSVAHNQFVSFTKRKRLGLNDKCVALGINLKKDDPKPTLMVNGNEIEFVKSTKCLGDMVSDERSNKILIEFKTSKGKAALVSLLALCNETTFGIHYISLGLLLYNSMFMLSLLFNSEVWTRLSKTDINNLQLIQLKTLKRVTHMPNSTTNCFMFLELGILPVIYEIHKRKLMFLYHIQSLAEHDPVKKVYYQQKKLPFERNWTTEVDEIISKYNIRVDDITEISRNVWRNRVLSEILPKAFEDLQLENSAKSKTKHLNYESLRPQNYVSKLPGYLATFLMKIRSRTLTCRTNHCSSSSSDDKQCRLCHQAEENQEHVVNCYAVNKDDEWLTLNEYYSTVNGNIDQTKLKIILDRYNNFTRMVDELGS